MKLEDLRKLAEARTKGEWRMEGCHIYHPDHTDVLVCDTGMIGDAENDNTRFIAAAANRFDALLDIADCLAHIERTGYFGPAEGIDTRAKELLAKLEEIR